MIATCGVAHQQSCGREVSKYCKSSPKPCIKHESTSARHQHAHGLQAQSRKTIGPQRTPRGNATCQQHVVHLGSNKHEAMKQANIAMPTPKPWTKHDTTPAMHTSEHSPAASPLKKDHWSSTDTQGQHNIIATCSMAQQQTYGGGASRHFASASISLMAKQRFTLS